jgi:hypothetical protein
MEIDKEWEKFSGGPFVPFRERVYVTLNGKGKLLLNRKAHEVLGKPKRVLLYFNRSKDTIGVRPAHDRLAEAFPVRHTGESCVVYCGTFLRHFGIRFSGTEKFVGADLNQQGLLQLDLSKTVSVGGWHRKRVK